ncbi:hypothetical protein ACOAKC_08020 [Hathewaya histolytica]|uniref:hypothetical protein n=1 Tax=Hathewaya histolytica TaxID=1498 RepID=UPI003B684C34
MKIDLDKYDSLELSNEDYAMVPIEMDMEFKVGEEELARSSDETYVEDFMESYFEQDLYRDEDSEEFDEEEFQQEYDMWSEEEERIFNEEYIKVDEEKYEQFEDEFFRTEDSIKPNFGVPLFIEERYLVNEEYYRNEENMISEEKEDMERDNRVDRIFMRIERSNPAIIRRLVRCGIPRREAEAIVKSIIRLTLMYS